jgi:tRNA A-37 threonylcarbamoyl transferase component Bud32
VSVPPEAIANDRLHTLSAALDPVGMREVLQPFAERLRGRSARIERIEIEVLRRRNKRCVQRYRLALSDGTRLGLVGKVFKAGRGEPVFADMQELWRRGFARRADEPVSMPEPLGFLPELGLLVQEEVPGVPLKDTLADANAPRRMRQLARVLIRLHGCGFRPGPPFRMRDHLSRCHPKLPFLGLACPDLEPEIERIVQRALELERGFDESACTAIHGDFHMAQVHVEGERSFLIDFDALCLGDPAADLGNVLVFLKGKAARLPSVPLLVEAFLEAYFEVMDPAIARRIPLYEAVTHLRRACKKLRLQGPRWEKKVRRMVARAADCIERA